MHVSTNGFVALGVDGGVRCCGSDLGELLAGAPHIAPFWTDLAPDRGGTVYVNDLGDRAVVTWAAISRFGASETGLNTVQLQLFPTGEVVFAYGPVAAADDSSDAVLVGLSTGEGAAPAAETSFLADLPFESVGQATVYELVQPQLFEQWHMAGGAIRFTPTEAAGTSWITLDRYQTTAERHFGAQNTAETGTVVVRTNTRPALSGKFELYDDDFLQDGANVQCQTGMSRP